GCLFRGVFLRSPDQDWMRDEDEIVPPRPDLVGSRWRQQHRNGGTETAYTSWSTNWEWSSPRKVDTGLSFIPSVRTPPGRRTPARSGGVDRCRRPRCTRRSPRGPAAGCRPPTAGGTSVLLERDGEG